MPKTIKNSAPINNDDLRKSIYNGDIYKLPATDQSLQIVDTAIRLITEEFKTEDIRKVYNTIDKDEYFYAIGRLRKKLFKEEILNTLLIELLEGLNFSVSDCKIEPLRLRAICHDGHLNPKAAPIYYPHRDTWYSHPQSLIVFWFPLDDLEENETFEFYPEYFNQPVQNDSQYFNYDQWIKDGEEKKIGWQNINTGTDSLYPTIQNDLKPKEKINFSCKKGEILIFSGSQYHKTIPQSLGTTRYSADFRLVNMKHYQNNLGAPNVDNQSQGSALIDYISLK